MMVWILRNSLSDHVHFPFMPFEGHSSGSKKSRYPALATLDVRDWMQFIIVPIEQGRKNLSHSWINIS